MNKKEKTNDINKITCEKVIDAIKGSGAIMATIAKRLELPRNEAMAYVQKWPDTIAAYDNENETIKDMCETVVISSAKEGSVNDAKYVLEKKQERIREQQKKRKKTGRPIKWTEEKQKNLLDDLNQYIYNNEIPILAEFAYINNVRRGLLYELPMFSDAIKRCIEKKEANLERLALKNDINISMAIFSLKQLGWSDKQEIEHSTRGNEPLRFEIIDVNKD